MIEKLRPYSEMRPSGLPWLGEVPVGWEVNRAKYSFQEVDDRSEQGDEELLSVSHKTGVTPRSQKNITMFMAESYEGHKICRPDDVVVNTMWAWMAAIGVSRHTGIVSPAYGIYRPRVRDRFEPRYLDYLLRTEIYRAEYVRSSRGITTSRLRLYPTDFLSIPFLQPPLDEQRLIVRFLNWHGAQTGKLIRAKKKIIALLNEQKQAIIHSAVTRGLHPDVHLKPSGIPWLGDMPEGWEVARLRYITRCLDGKRIPLNGTQRDSMQGEHPYWGANRVFDHINAWLFDEPLVLLGEDGAPFFDIGKDVAFAVDGKIWVNNHAHILRCGPRITTQFLAHALNCVDYRNFISGSTRDKLTQQAMGSIPIQVPQLSEQRAIVDHLNVATSELVMTANQIQLEIALIQEFRTRLIADVVTGKLDARSAAASLPETVEIEPIAALVQGDDLDEAVDESEDEEVAA